MGLIAVSTSLLESGTPVKEMKIHKKVIQVRGTI